MENVRCDLCGSDEKQPYLDQRDRFGRQVFSLVRCINCGLIYQDPRPDQGEMDNHYPTNYEAFERTEIGEGLSDLTKYQTSLFRQLDFLETYAPGRGRLLDIGCATGNFLRVAQSRGWQVSGIEPNTQVAQIARDSYDLNVQQGTLDTVSLPPAHFDVITFWDVLEHVHSPRQTLERVYELLRPHGVVIFSIPNINSFDRLILGSRWIGWDLPRHLTLLDQTTIPALLAKTGYNQLGSRCITGGKGTLFLSLDNLRQEFTFLSWLKHFYPIIGLLLWPYRQFSYFLNRGPIITYAVQKTVR